jgi:hypothetical protein
MQRSRAVAAPTIAVVLAVALLALYLDALRTGFLNDDYLFLEQARAHGPGLLRLDALGNYWRPLSRQVYFALLAPIGSGQPLVFHAFDFAIFLGAIALLADLLRGFAGPAGVLAGLAWFALLPMQRVNLTWISCSQDLLALAGALGALAAWRRDRPRIAAIAYLAAIASKESALALPLALLAWERWIARRDWRAAALRVAPLAGLGAAWAGAAAWVTARSGGHPPLELDAGAIPAAFAHLAQSLVGIEHPPGFAASVLSHPPALFPLIALGAAAFFAGNPPAGAAGASAASAAARAGAGDAAAARRRRESLGAAGRFALAWVVAFGLVTWPVTHTWSGYYYTLAAAGVALPIAILAERLDRLALAALCAALLWWHAGGTGTRAFAIADQPWNWTSHLTTYYFQRGAALTDTLSRQLRASEPRPAQGERFFFATLPPWAGFQMGNGPLVRALYRDPTLQSYFYSQFSESTASEHPCRFFYWDGLSLQPLYGRAADPLFQVGCDLLLFDKPAGAAHAFRRALASGGRREDNLYWLGWAELWSGHRPEAEAAWTGFGAVDDTATARRRFLEVRDALYFRRDTLAARRLLLEAIRAGIGLPNPHAVLGEVLWPRGGEEARYGLLELKIASWLNPRDVLAQRELIAGLVATHIDDAARRQLDRLKQVDPTWFRDTLTAGLVRTLDERAPDAGGVAVFE